VCVCVCVCGGGGGGGLSADHGLVLVLGGRDDHRMPLSPQLQPSAATAGRCVAPPRHAMPCHAMRFMQPRPRHPAGPSGLGRMGGAA
jgi:hypothetical protein